MSEGQKLEAIIRAILIFTLGALILDGAAILAWGPIKIAVVVVGVVIVIKAVIVLFQAW